MGSCCWTNCWIMSSLWWLNLSESSPHTEMHLEDLSFDSTTTSWTKKGKNLSKPRLPLSSHDLQHLVTRIVIYLTVILTHLFTNNSSIFQCDLLMQKHVSTEQKAIFRRQSVLHELRPNVLCFSPCERRLYQVSKTIFQVESALDLLFRLWSV